MRTFLFVLILAAAVGPAGAVEVGDRDLGLAYARENCTECHAVDPGEFESPNPDAPPFQEIADIPAMSELALLSFFQTPHELMPNFMVPAAEQRNLIAYILSLKN